MTIWVSVELLQQYCDPYRSNPLDNSKLTRAEVRKALVNRTLESIPGTKKHAERIAFFVQRGIKDPIELDVGVPALGYETRWMCTDGNHRLAAAIYTKQKLILADISGQVDYIKTLFGLC